ncbi:hypothetical protein HDV02_002365 [Globomyces sp. JEL0801]|nr:hypothetical protein HDV02_002365 [Globomyces sp. JEL0801]
MTSTYQTLTEISPDPHFASESIQPQISKPFPYGFSVKKTPLLDVSHPNSFWSRTDGQQYDNTKVASIFDCRIIIKSKD